MALSSVRKLQGACLCLRHSLVLTPHKVFTPPQCRSLIHVRSQSRDKDDQHTGQSNDSQQNTISANNASDNQRPDITSPEVPSDVDEFVRQTDIDYNNWSRLQSRRTVRPRVDPQETSILLFPGQGSQFVGMGHNLLQYPIVLDMFQTARKILGYDLLRICLDGPKDDLDKTVHCQPAIFVTSLAAVEKLRIEKPQVLDRCIATAGFSVGEYAALTFAGAMSFEDALWLVKIRAEAMQKASEVTPSGMMSVFLKPDAKVKFACHTAKRFCSERLDIENPVCEVANYLYPGCKVLAGHQPALEFIKENGQEFGIRRYKQLPVSGAFHTALMRPAKPALQKALEEIEISKPVISVQANVNSYRYRRADTIKQLLVRQICEPVKWEQTLHVLFSRQQGKDFPETYELGPAGQLGSLLRMVNVKAHQNYHKVTV